MANNIDRVRILIVGDSGVGKTCLSHLIAYNQPLMRSSWTVGCTLEVKLHEYSEGTPQHRPYFIELLDIGGSVNNQNARSVFYTPTHGIILAYDVANRKSHDNLFKWLGEVLNKDGKDTCKPYSSMYKRSRAINRAAQLIGCGDQLDLEQLIGAAQVPVLVVGTKLDLVDDKRLQSKSIYGADSIASKCGAEEITLDCLDARSLAAGKTAAVKLSRFFDQVIDRRLHSSSFSAYTGNAERRKANLSATATETTRKPPLLSPRQAYFTSPLDCQ